MKTALNELPRPQSLAIDYFGKESGGERSDGKGREGEATGKSCIQDGGRINGGFPGVS